MLPELYYIAGAAVAVCEVLLVQPLLSVTAQKVSPNEPQQASRAAVYPSLKSISSTLYIAPSIFRSATPACMLLAWSRGKHKGQQHTPDTQARCKEAPLPLEELLQGVQLCSEPEQAELPETELLLGFLHGEADALVTVIDLVGSPRALHRF